MNSLIVAAAGSGKTTHIVRTAVSELRKVGIFTFTNDNEEQIRRSIYKLKGYIPENISIFSWFSFLLKHGVRPYQSYIHSERIRGINLVSNKSGFRYQGKFGPVYWGENDVARFYFDESERMFSDKIAKYVVRCNELSSGATLRRLRKLYDIVFIDEVQDFAGYDLEFLRLMMQEGIEVHAVGDPRQCTYQTHIDQKYKKYSGAGIADFFRNECRKNVVVIDETTLQVTFRNNDRIVSISAQLYPKLSVPKSGHKATESLHGVHFIPISELDVFLSEKPAMQLRYSIAVTKVSRDYPVMNIGKSKGLEFDNVVLFPTEDMQAWLLGSKVVMKEKTRALLYVAITRARYTVAVVIPDKEFKKLDQVALSGSVHHRRARLKNS
jgi:DNA helicase II / ATP-dependent DNA helicase PcrA